MTLDPQLVKDDFYEGVNGAWIAQAEIPADKSATGGFNDLVDDVEKTLMADFAAMSPATAEDPRFQEFLKFYALAKDFDAREKVGVAPLQKVLAKIEAVANFTDLNALLPELFLNNLATPFDLDVSADMKNAAYNALYVSPVSLILPDKTSYDAENPQKDALLKVYADMTVELFQKLGKTADEAADLAKRTLAFDASLVPFVKSSEESAEYAKSYNPQDFASFSQSSNVLAIQDVVTTLLGQTPDTIIVTEPAFFENYNQIVNEETFADLKAWLLVKTAISLASLTTEELRQISGIFARTLTGRKVAQSQEKSAFYLAIGTYKHVVGDYYGQKYFGAAAKADVLNMVQRMIDVYKKRLSTNTWLSASTREKALVKLNAIVMKVGFPDAIEDIYDQLKVQDTSLLENDLAFTKLFVLRNFSEWQQPVNKERWGMSANTVNAYYSPSQNQIVFPAAILQAPFYSLEQSSAANFGGIGAVIAHEISHAFDNNGAQFDEIGNLNNWWTAEDLAYFKDLAEKMVAEFDGVATPAGKVNGRLTVSENIADAGGLSCALEALKEESNPDLAAFFINWATIWRTKQSLAYQQMLLAFDVHGPAKLRANLQVKNLPEFYTTFDVTENDQMYLAPDKRVAIW